MPANYSTPTGWSTWLNTHGALAHCARNRVISWRHKANCKQYIRYEIFRNQTRYQHQPTQMIKDTKCTHSTQIKPDQTISKSKTNKKNKIPSCLFSRLGSVAVAVAGNFSRAKPSKSNGPKEWFRWKGKGENWWEIKSELKKKTKFGDLHTVYTDTHTQIALFLSPCVILHILIQFQSYILCIVHAEWGC